MYPPRSGHQVFNVVWRDVRGCGVYCRYLILILKTSNCHKYNLNKKITICFMIHRPYPHLNPLQVLPQAEGVWPNGGNLILKKCI